MTNDSAMSNPELIDDTGLAGVCKINDLARGGSSISFRSPAGLKGFKGNSGTLEKSSTDRHHLGGAEMGSRENKTKYANSHRHEGIGAM